MYGIILICLFAMNFSPGSANECSANSTNTYPECWPRYHNITVPEDMTKNMDILQINCTDPEGMKMTWKITEGNIKGFFKVSNEGMLMTKKRLDAEGKANPYLLYIEARDLGEPSLTSTVVVTVFMTSVNDEPPLMLDLPEVVHVPENTPRGTVIASCTLQDADSARLPVGLARVEIIDGNQDDVFRLDRRTCALTLRQRVDYETMAPRRLLFRAYELDTAAPLTTLQNVTIIIDDFNDHPPVCSDYIIMVTLPEDTLTGTNVTSLNCWDTDVSAQLQYTIIAGSPDKLAVDSTTGEITLAQGLDFEVDARNFDVTVHVTDSTDYPFTVTIIINVQITDVDDNLPDFGQDTINVELAENSDLDLVIWTLTTTDADSPDTPLSAVTYSLLSSTADWFNVHSQTGIISVKRLLDRETEENVYVTVSAYSSNRTTATSTVVLHINITDVNDNRPVFNQTLYTGRVSESATLGTAVCTVMADDADSDRNGDIIFSTDSALFSIHPTTGIVSLSAPLDYERHKVHTFVVTATDDAEASATSQPLTSQALVTIEVDGSNEAGPVWQTPDVNDTVYSIAESTPAGSILFTVSASDDDEGEDGRLTYRLVQPTPLSLFLLHEDRGVVTLLGPLDREVLDAYTLVIEARDSSLSDPKSSTITLIVSVSDSNDNAPICQHLAPVFVPVAAAVGDPLVTLNCSDLDLVNGVMTFVKVGGDAAGVFRVEPNSGEVRLFREPTESRYVIGVEVRDGGDPEFSTDVTVTFIIEEAFSFQNLPEIVEVAEDALVGNVVFLVETAGTRLPVFYEITSVEDVLAVQPSTGELILNAALDRETKDTFNITVSAYTAAGHRIESSIAFSVTDVNDNIPKISGTFSMSVSENLTVPHVLQTFSAHDEDFQENGTVTFSITAGNEDGRFSLSADGTLEVVSSLNAEGSQLHELVIVGTDGGNSPLSAEKRVLITVRDVDEFQPEFIPVGKNSSIIIPENFTIGSPVFQIMASDEDLSDSVKFELVSGNSGNTFTIDKGIGRIYLAAPLNREERDRYDLAVKVFNHKEESKVCDVSITVSDVNDNAPTFSLTRYSFDVSDKTQPVVAVGEVFVSDPDYGLNGEVDVDIVTGNDEGVFMFDGTTLKTANTTDIAVASSYALTILATDRGLEPLTSQSLVWITVIPLNKPPKFMTSEDSITVPENSVVGLQIYDFQATAHGAIEGQSGGDLLYSIESGNAGSEFYLNPQDGKLYAVGTLDYEAVQQYTVVIRAENRKSGELVDFARLMVDVSNVNDASPLFSDDYSWSIAEGVHASVPVGVVSATDDDLGLYGQISYSLHGDERFSVNPEGGVAFTGRLDYGENSYFHISILAVDNAGFASLTGTTTVDISVTDVNDHAPVFPQPRKEVSLPESTPPESVVEVLLPEDGDYGNNGRVTCHITHGNQAGKFRMDPTACALITAGMLDLETQPLFDLTITATDGGLPPLAGTLSVVVHVTDDNDNTPTFDPSSVHLQLHRIDKSETKVYLGEASDKDSGNNGQIFYAIQSGNTNGVFAVDPMTGQVRTVTSLAHADDAYTLILTATDRGFPARTGTLTVSVDIYPRSVPPPSAMTFNVPENSGVGTVAGTAAPEPGKTIVSSYITGGNYKSAFSVATDSDGNSSVQVAGPLDRETYREYHLEVERQLNDGSDSLAVKIVVTDVNDHVPYVSTPNLAFPVVENLGVSNTVATLQILDDDDGANSEWTLSFLDTSSFCDIYFNLESTGAVTIKQPLDFEALRELSCEVVVKDKGDPPLSSTSMFTATVVDTDEELVEVVGEKATVYRSLEIPHDSAAGHLTYTLSPDDFGFTFSAAAASGGVEFFSVNENGVFAVSTAGAFSLSRADLLYAKSRYFQWLVCRHEGAGTQLAMMRVDTFIMDESVVAITFAAAKEDLDSQRSIIKARLQLFFSNNTRVELLEIRDLSGPPSRRRRLLDQRAVVLIYVVADTSVDDIGNVDMSKTFLTQDEILQILQLSRDGTPIPGLVLSSLPVLEVMPYRKDPDLQPPTLLKSEAQMALVFLLIAFGVVIVILLFICCMWRLCIKNKRKARISKHSKHNGPVPDSKGRTVDDDDEGDISIITTSDVPLGRRKSSLAFKRELDTLLPMSLLVSHKLQQQVPPSATSGPGKLDAAKQAAINQLIQEKKNSKKKKASRQPAKPADALPSSQAKIDSTAVVPRRKKTLDNIFEAEGSSEDFTNLVTASSSPPTPTVVTPRLVACVRAAHDKPTTAGQSSGTPRQSPSPNRLRVPDGGSGSPQTLLTARSVVIESVGVPRTKTATTPEESPCRKLSKVDEDGIPVVTLDEGTGPEKKQWAKPAVRKTSFYASFISRADSKKQNAHLTKRGSMPIVISKKQKERVEAIVADKNKHGGRTRKISFETRDVAESDMMKLEDGLVKRRVDLPDQVPDIRRQSFFV